MSVPSEHGESGEPHAPRFEPEEEAVSSPGKSSQLAMCLSEPQITALPSIHLPPSSSMTSNLMAYI